MSFTPNLFLNHNPFMSTLYGSSGFGQYSAFAGPKASSPTKQEDNRMQSRVFTWTDEHLQRSQGDKQVCIAPFPGFVYQQSPGMPLFQSP